VVLVFIIVWLVQFFVWGALGTGRLRLIAPIFFGISAIIESHHMIKTIVRLDYFPGAVTAIPFVAVRVMLLRAAVREWRGGSNLAISASSWSPGVCRRPAAW
jgi:hypothetical protein